MDPATSLWIVAPAAGAAIGWATNALAVRMLFRPHQPRRVLGLTFQGLIARRQEDLAASIGAVVGDHLIDARDLARALEGADLEGLVDEALASGLEPKLAELRRLPLVGGFLTDERVADLRSSLSRSSWRLAVATCTCGGSAAFPEMGLPTNISSRNLCISVFTAMNAVLACSNCAIRGAIAAAIASAFV